MYAPNLVVALGMRMMRLFNWALLVAQFFAGLSVASLLVMRDDYFVISNHVYGDDALLMNNPVTDFVIRPETAVFVVLLLLFSLWKEFKVEPLRWRIGLNSGLVVLLEIGRASCRERVYIWVGGV